ncbi:potassium channel family protein [Aurantimonas sp. HBX-1]|uniref:potassium channel family protein n=1 Tax=Aurantimonas sp. HBX-1 TaxID=2906072 RepID=UPI001F361C79|nr:potassium channel family protein [Aurantimonas sp. HBX-1]UIJ73342.1 potassium channel family protein [Aurantimonas sp. HBX-1]
MRVLILLVGVLLIASILLDAFLTVLDANGRSLFSVWAYRWFWWLWRHLSRLLPPASAHQMLTLGAPLMIPMMIALWTGGLVTGFALVYFGGLEPQDQFALGRSGTDIANAFRLSFVTLSTIGFVEISPSNMPYSVVVALEAILGSILITLTVTYYLSVQDAVAAHGRFVTGMQHRMPDARRPFSAAGVFLSRGSGETLSGWLDTLHDGTAALHEGLRRYPIVYYFRPSERRRGLPQTLAALREVTAGLLWHLPAGHPVARSPELLALQVALLDLTQDLAHRYVPIRTRTIARPVEADMFAAAFHGRLYAPDAWVERFLEERAAVRDLLNLERSDRAEDAYREYRGWLAFVVPLHDFERSIRADLGYSERFRPGRSSTVVSVIARGPKDRPQQLERVRELRP